MQTLSSPKVDWLISPKLWKFDPPNVEIFPQWSLFRKTSIFIVQLDLAYAHPIVHHQISLISYPYHFASFQLVREEPRVNAIATNRMPLKPQVLRLMVVKLTTIDRCLSGVGIAVGDCFTVDVHTPASFGVRQTLLWQVLCFVIRVTLYFVISSLKWSCSQLFRITSPMNTI